MAVASSSGGGGADTSTDLLVAGCPAFLRGVFTWLCKATRFAGWDLWLGVEEGARLVVIGVQSGPAGHRRRCVCEIIGSQFRKLVLGNDREFVGTIQDGPGGLLAQPSQLRLTPH